MHLCLYSFTPPLASIIKPKTQRTNALSTSNLLGLLQPLSKLQFHLRTILPIFENCQIHYRRSRWLLLPNQQFEKSSSLSSRLVNSFTSHKHSSYRSDDGEILVKSGRMGWVKNLFNHFKKLASAGLDVITTLKNPCNKFDKSCAKFNLVCKIYPCWQSGKAGRTMQWSNRYLGLIKM